MFDVFHVFNLRGLLDLCQVFGLVGLVRMVGLRILVWVCIVRDMENNDKKFNTEIYSNTTNFAEQLDNNELIGYYQELTMLEMSEPGEWTVTTKAVRDEIDSRIKNRTMSHEEL